MAQSDPLPTFRPADKIESPAAPEFPEWPLSELTASSLGRGDPLALPLQHDLALKLGYRPDDIEE
jgi:hypothetical protein